MIKKVVCTLIVAAALCGAVRMAPASAQDWGAIGNEAAIQAGLQANLDNVVRHSVQAAHGAKSSKSSRGSSLRDSMALTVRRPNRPLGSSGSAGALTFRPSAAVRQRVLASFVAATRKKSPIAAAELQKAFASQDVFAWMGRGMARYGFKTNNLADATAIYMTVAWLGARGSDADLPKAQMLAVRGQMARALASTPSLARATSAQKQELSDTLLVLALLFDGSIQVAKKQPATMAQTKAIIAQNVRATFGLDLNALKITNQGLQT